jgi:hypothetical protein
MAAGDRMPDAPLASVQNGTQTTLFAVMRGARHKLLLLPGSRDPQATSHLLKIADEAQRDFPEMFSVHVILKPGDEAAAPTSSRVPSTASFWLDAEGRLHQHLGATDRALVLVRPDGYIGYRSQPADAAALEKYLDRYLVRKS